MIDCKNSGVYWLAFNTRSTRGPTCVAEILLVKVRDTLYYEFTDDVERDEHKGTVNGSRILRLFLAELKPVNDDGSVGFEVCETEQEAKRVSQEFYNAYVKEQEQAKQAI